LIKIIQNKYHIPPGNSPSSGKHGKYVQPFCVKYASFKTTDDFASSLRVKRIQTIPLPPYMPHPPHVAPWSKGRRIFFLAPLYFVGHTICPPHIWPPWGSGGPKMGAYEGGVVLSILVCEINIVSAHSVTASHIFFEEIRNILKPVNTNDWFKFRIKTTRLSLLNHKGCKMVGFFLSITEENEYHWCRPLPVGWTRVGHMWVTLIQTPYPPPLYDPNFVFSGPPKGVQKGVQV